jgi:hypothetical protein
MTSSQPSLALCPIKEDSRTKKIQDPSSVPTNMTLLSAFFKISSTKGRNPFEKQKVWKNNKEVKGEVRNPVIYFTFTFVTNEDPEDLLVRVSHKWHRRGGIVLKVKDLQTFKSKTILCLFNIFTSTPKKTVLHEFKEILSKAQQMAQEFDSLDYMFDLNDLPTHSTLLAIELRLVNPKLPGQDTLHFNKLSWKAQANRKVFHIECDSCYLAEIKHLTQFGKEHNIVKEMWGKHAHISEVVDKDSTPSEIKRLMRVSQIHTNYQCSMLLEDLVGITDLNASADLYQASMMTPLHFSLQQVLLRFVQLSDGHRLFAEVHQSNEVMGQVQAVIPNTPEAEQMVLMMNENFPAYIGNALRDQGLPDDFLLELLKRSCCPTLVS